MIIIFTQALIFYAPLLNILSLFLILWASLISSNRQINWNKMEIQSDNLAKNTFANKILNFKIFSRFFLIIKQLSKQKHISLSEHTLSGHFIRYTCTIVLCNPKRLFCHKVCFYDAHNVFVDTVTVLIKLYDVILRS